MVSAMKCKHARVKQLAHKRKTQVKKLVKVVAKLIKAKKASEKAAKLAVAASNTARKASLAAVKAADKQKLSNAKANAKIAIKKEKLKTKAAITKAKVLKKQAAKAVAKIQKTAAHLIKKAVKQAVSKTKKESAAHAKFEMAKIIKKARATVENKKPKVVPVPKIPKKIGGKKVVVKYVHVSKAKLHIIHKEEAKKAEKKAKKNLFK